MYTLSARHDRDRVGFTNLRSHVQRVPCACCAVNVMQRLKVAFANRVFNAFVDEFIQLIALSIWHLATRSLDELPPAS
jgi:hypothetical protein